MGLECDRQHRKLVDESYRQFGYTPDTFSGEVVQALTRIHPEDRARVKRAIQTVLDGKAKNYAEQYRVVRPMGLRAGSMLMA